MPLPLSRLPSGFAWKGALAILVLGAVFVAGGYLAVKNLWPFSSLRAVKAFLMTERPPMFLFDPYTRLVAQRTKEEVPCPPQDARTAVLLILGQSNAANHTGQGYRSEHGSRVVNFHDGRCFLAASPLLGSTGAHGEYWTLLANLLVSAGTFERVVLVPAAVAGSVVTDWAPGGALDPVLRATLEALKPVYTPTQVLWHQGESDYGNGTSEADYRAAFLRFLASLRDMGVAAPVHVSTATDCWWEAFTTDNPVARAQAALPDESLGIKAGVNTDLILGDLDRYDDCHLSGSGGEKTARAWADILARP